MDELLDALIGSGRPKIPKRFRDFCHLTPWARFPVVLLPGAYQPIDESELP
jgi:hypothetical protein